MRIINLFRKFKSFIQEKELNQIVELDPDTRDIFDKIKPFTMTNEIRLWSMYQSLKWINNKKVDGDIVETGCWKGGNLFLANMYEKLYGKNNRIIYGYDTFSGMPTPTKEDFKWQQTFGQTLNRWKKNSKQNTNQWAYTSLEDTKKNAEQFLSKHKIKFVQGMIEDTLKLKKNLPKKISLLRIDTNFYSSTKIALEILEPLVQKDGVIIFDDYGSWVGASKAIDNYFVNKPIWLHRVDRGSRLLIKNY
ncbi:TylF/MycF family methyltransferase [Alphaproteobacteria bacterium]|nr:TylF/MycF family methyltransferase [Alphaproteobacteria bacterium]